MYRPEFIIEELKKNFPDADLGMVWRAYAFAAQCHRGQKRVSGEPYLNHPLEVAYILAKMKLGHVSVSVGLLHDTVEDTLATEEQIKEMFGEEVWGIVGGVTKLTKIESATYEERQAENIRKMILAMADDIRVILVKLADRIHNMRTLEFMKPDKQRQISQETLDIYAPLANRLGINWVKSELENSAFKYIWPSEYSDIKHKVTKLESERETYIEEIVASIKEALEPVVTGVDVKGRPKHYFSIFQKMRRQQITFEEVYDIMGVRIIAPADQDCYTVLGIIHSMFKPIPDKLKDYVGMPKANMYQSIHTSVVGPGGKPVEIQIRSSKMHAISEEGIAAHWRYKEGGAKEGKNDDQIIWLRRLLEWQQEVKNPREFLEKVKIDLFPDEVYVFTPQQEVKSFPKGATAIDFAYAVHTDVGHHCIGAKINGNLASIRHELKNGDIIEILTSKQAKPSRDWLKGVATSKARTKIASFLHQAERVQAKKLGKEMLTQELDKYGIDSHAFTNDKALTSHAKHSGYNSADSLLIAIGLGKFKLSQALAKVLPKETPEELDRKVEELAEHAAKTRRSTSGVKIGAMDDMLTRFAKCCTPAPGEPIIGFISRGRGLVIHSADCPNAFNMGLDSDRRLDVQWDMESAGKTEVALFVVTEDRPGILASVSTAISDEGANITEAKTSTSFGGAGRGSITLFVEIDDITQLDKIIKIVSEREGVISVERVRNKGSIRAGAQSAKGRH